MNKFIQALKIIEDTKKVLDTIQNVSNTFSMVSNIVSPFVKKEKFQSGADLIKKLINFWSGQTIIFIGPTASGKDSILNALHEKEVSEIHAQTRGVEKIKKHRRTFLTPNGSIELKLSSTSNVGGEIDQRERYWLDACKPCDIIFYLVDCGELINNNKYCVNRIKDDLRWIVGESSNFKSDLKIVVILNKIDLIIDDDLSDSCNEKNISELSDGIKLMCDKYLSLISNRLLGVFPLSSTKKDIFVTNFTKILKVTMEKSQ